MSVNRWVMLSLIVMLGVFAGYFSTRLPLAPMAQPALKMARRPIESPLEKLGLTPRQRDRLMALHQQQRVRHWRTMKLLKTKHRQMDRLLFSANASRREALALHREITRLKGRLDAERIREYFALRALLTPGQRRRLPYILPEHGGRHTP